MKFLNLILSISIFLFFTTPLFSQTEIFYDGFEEDPSLTNFPYKWRQFKEEENRPGLQYAAFNKLELHPRLNETPPQIEVHSGKKSCTIYAWSKDSALETRDFISVNSARKYELTGWVKMKNVKNNKFYLTFTWFNKLGSPISSENSIPIYGETDWVQIKSEFYFVPKEAKYAKIKCNFEGGDIKAVCFIDDISLKEYIKLEVKSKIFAGIFGTDDYVDYNISSAELTPGNYELVCSIKNYKNENLHDFLINKSTLESEKFKWDSFFLKKKLKVPKEGDLKISFTIPPVLEKGYYEIDFSLYRDNNLVVNNLKKFVVIEKTKAIPMPTEWFGTAISPDVFYSDGLASALEDAEIGICKLIHWDARSELKEPLKKDTLKKFFLELRSKGVTIENVLKDAPLSFGFQRATSIVSHFSVDKDIWQNTLEQFITQQKLQSWSLQIGFDDDKSVAKSFSLQGIVDNIKKVVGNVSPGMNIGLPFDSSHFIKTSNITDFLLNAKERKIDFVTIDFEKSKTHYDIENILPLVSNLKGLYKINFSFELDDCPEKESFDTFQTRNGELVKKIVLANSSNLVNEIYVHPFFDTSPNTLIHLDENTTSTYIVIKNILNNIGKKRFIARDFFLVREVKSYIFEGLYDDVIVVWTDSANSDYVELSGGSNVRVLDLCGNDISDNIADGKKILEYQNAFKCKIRVFSNPIFVVNVDKDIIRFQLDSKIEPDNIFHLSDTSQQKNLRIHNSYDRDIEIKNIRIIFPKGWQGYYDFKFKPTIAKYENLILKTDVLIPRDFFLKYEEGFHVEKIGLVVKYVANKYEEVEIWKPITLKKGMAVMILEQTLKDDVLTMKIEIKNASNKTMQLYGYFTLKGNNKLVDGPLKRWIYLKEAGSENDKTILSFTINTEGKKVDEFYILLNDESGNAFLNTKIPIK